MSGPNRTRAGLWCGALLAAVVAVNFYPVLKLFYAQDDFGWFRLAVGPWRTLRGVLTAYHGGFTPLSNAMVALLVRVFGLNPAPQFAALLSLHLIAVWLTYAIARAIRMPVAAALAAGLVFATAFAHWEALMWLVGGLVQVWTTVLVLVTVLAWCRGFRVLALVAFAISLLAKETASAGLLVLAGHTWWLGAARSAGEPGEAPRPLGDRVLALRGLVPFALVWLAYLGFEAFGFRFGRLVEASVYPASFGFHAIVNEARYLVTLVLPDPSSPFVAPHLAAISPSLLGAVTAATTAALVALPFVLGWIAWRGGVVARFAIAWMVVTLLPFVFLTLPLASRYLYLPSVGFALLVGLGFERLRPRFPRAAVAALVALLLVNFVANRLAERVRFANGEVRRGMLQVMSEVVRRERPSRLVLVGVPEKYRDVGEGVLLWLERPIDCDFVDFAGGAVPAGAAVLEFRDGALVARARR